MDKFFIKDFFMYDFVIAICIVIFFICIRGVVSKIFSNIIQKFLSKFEKWQYYSEFVIKFSSIIKNLIIVLGIFLSLDFFHIPVKYEGLIVNILITFVNAHVFYTLIIITNPIINIFHRKIDLGIRSWTSRLIKIFILLLMLTNILSILIFLGAGIFLGFKSETKGWLKGLILGIIYLIIACAHARGK